MDRERGAGYYNFYLIFFVFVSTRRRRDCCFCCWAAAAAAPLFLYLSLVEGWSDAIYFHPAILIWLEDGTHSGFVYVIFPPHPRRSKREITNSLSSAQQLTRRKALGEIKKTFFLSFVFFLFRKSQISCSSPPALFPSSVIRLLFVYQLFPSVSQFEREETAGVSVCVCVCPPSPSSSWR